MTDAKSVSNILDDLLFDAMHEGETHDVARVESFNVVGIMTGDAGFVMMMRDGSEFQVTVV